MAAATASHHAAGALDSLGLADPLALRLLASRSCSA